MTNIEFWSLFVDSTATILAATAIFVYILFWYREKSNNSYDVFDATYLDLLKTAMEYPSFRNPSLTSNYEQSFSGDDKIRYELYAFMTYNFCETIFDKRDKQLMKTWSVIIETESALHQQWFRKVENRAKFKNSFCSYISNLPLIQQ
jgi:hypothetical protein